MTLEESITSRINDLIKTGEPLATGDKNGQVVDEDHRQECSAWLTSAQSVIYGLLSDANQPYRQQIDRICAMNRGIETNDYVGEARLILQALLVDAAAGLIGSVQDGARAEVFDDFIDHASDYLRRKHKSEAGVIAGVVFEDSIRRAYRKFAGSDKGVQLDEVISELARRNVLSVAKAKRARAAAHVRTKATHAQWDEFQLDDVAATIEFTRNFVIEVIDK